MCDKDVSLKVGYRTLNIEGDDDDDEGGEDGDGGERKEPLLVSAWSFGVPCCHENGTDAWM